MKNQSNFVTYSVTYALLANLCLPHQYNIEINPDVLQINARAFHRILVPYRTKICITVAKFYFNNNQF